MVHENTLGASISSLKARKPNELSLNMLDNRPKSMSISKQDRKVLQAITDNEEEERLVLTFQVGEHATTAHIALMHQLAIAIITREHLPPPAATQLIKELHNITACTLYLMVEPTSSMSPLPLMSHGSAVAGAVRTQGGAMGRGTAAWISASSGAVLYGRLEDLQRSGSNTAGAYSDWISLASTERGIKSFLTAPVRLPGCISSGSMTFSSTEDTISPEQRIQLVQFARCLCSALSHESKFVCETSLGFLAKFMPATVIQAILKHPGSSSTPASTPLPSSSGTMSRSGSLALGVLPQQGAGLLRCVSDPQPQSVHAVSIRQLSNSSMVTVRQQVDAAAATLAAADAAGFNSTLISEGPGAPGSLDRAMNASAFIELPAAPGSSSSASTSTGRVQNQCREEMLLPSEIDHSRITPGREETGRAYRRTHAQFDESSSSEEELHYTSHSSVPTRPTASGVKKKAPRQPFDPNRQLWSLQFADYRKENRFQRYVRATQLGLDLTFFKLNAAAFVVLFSILLWRQTFNVGAIVLALQAMNGLIVPALFHSTPLYPKYRTVLIVSCRLVTALVLFVHWCLDPAYYSGNILKALTARSVPRLLASSVHNRLSFPVHAAAVLMELYLSAAAAAYVYSGMSPPPGQYMGLNATFAVQGVAALASLGISYLMEKRARKQFLSVRPRNS